MFSHGGKLPMSTVLVQSLIFSILALKSYKPVPTVHEVMDLDSCPRLNTLLMEHAILPFQVMVFVFHESHWSCSLRL